MDIKELRKEIDRIDDELVKLFVERMNVCRDVALYKKENGAAVYDAARER